MFDALRARLRKLQAAPARARELAAQRLTARCNTGHVDATSDGLAIRTQGAFLSPEWAAVIDESIADALRESR
jgi:hypothetical protein